MPIESFKYLGLISILVAWLGLGFMIYKWRGDTSMSLSDHAAANNKAYFWMAVDLSIALPLFFLFAYKWLIPTLALPQTALYILALATIGDLTAAWVPEGPDTKGKIHKIGSYSMAGLLIPFTLLIFLSPRLSPAVVMVSLAALLYMIAIAGLFVFAWKTKSNLLNYYLYFQISYVVVFHLTVLAAVYIR